MTEPALSFEGASKIYEYSHLGRTTYTRGVEGLDLSIASGEAFGLLGLNGSGKTTAFKLALGLLRPSSGRVLLFGRPPGQDGVAGRTGYLPELPYFYPFMTPIESLRFYGRLSGLAGADLEGRIAQVVADTGLADVAQRKVGQLSKGLVQRVGLAQAVLHDPQLIILDEPVSGLDPLAIKRFRDSLALLKRGGKTLLISSHSISEIEKLCDRVGVLKEGRLVRVLNQSDWACGPGGLEERFVEAVQ